MSAIDSLPAWRAAAAAPIVAQAEHLDQAVTVLSRAFDADPVTDWFLRADAHRSAAMHSMFTGILGGWALELGQTYLAADGGACALFLPPDPHPEGRGVWGWAQLLWRIRNTTGLARLGRGIRLIHTMDLHHPHEPPHYYLWFLGVDPARAGHGLGAILLDAVLTKYDREGVPTYLENSNPKNHRFYERMGYRSLGEFRPIGGGPPLEPMWRDVKPR